MGGDLPFGRLRVLTKEYAGLLAEQCKEGFRSGGRTRPRRIDGMDLHPPEFTGRQYRNQLPLGDLAPADGRMQGADSPFRQ
jgi:hypothetical protein